VLYVDNAGPLSHAAVLQHRAIANGGSALVGGIGGVVTVPTAQRRGYAGQLVRYSVDFLGRDWKVDFALLFCLDRMVNYYERLGFRTVGCEVLVDQPARKIPSPFNVMTRAFNPRFDVIESIDLGSAPW
jgi:predicted GNAT family N-acyltransferase